MAPFNEAVAFEFAGRVKALSLREATGPPEGCPSTPAAKICVEIFGRASLEELFSTSTRSSTVAEPSVISGVVTNVPQWATCRGAVLTSHTLR